MSAARLSRRSLIVGGAAALGGLAVGWLFYPFGRMERVRALAGRADAALLGPWLRIGADNSVTVIVPHAEMGQGVHTALPMMLAEELDADWSQVRVEQAPADLAFVNDALARGYLLGQGRYPWPADGAVEAGMRRIAEFTELQLTGGSMSVRFTGIQGMRRLGAAGRAMLVAAAAEAWRVPEREVEADAGMLHHRPSGRRETFGALAERASGVGVGHVTLKPSGRYRIVGRRLPRFDIPAKVDGSLVYGMDVRVPGMLFGAIRTSPVFGGTLKGVDETPALAVPGVKRVVRQSDAVVVLADNTWRARSAIAALEPEWDDGPNGRTSSQSIAASMDAALDRGEFVEEASTGDVDAALAKAERRVEAVYRLPYLAHATMETMNCTVSFKAGRLTVWGGFQHPLMARKLAADVAGLDPADVEVVHVAMGGGFGRRGSFMDYLERAVPIAMEAGAPVQLAWSREEDIAKGFYRNAAVARLEGALGPDGRIVAFRSSFTDRHEPKEATAIPYAIPHQSLRYVETENPVPWASWRSVDASLHGFFIESFVDELAHAAAADPLEFRLAHLDPASRARNVLERVAEMATWGTPPPAGRARGIAMRESFGTVVAQVAEVSLDAFGAIKVHRLFSACDPGEVVNPATFEAQIRGGANFGLSAALYGEITIQDGRVVEQNFPDYEVVRMADAPRQEVATLASDGPVGGAGEPGTPPVAPAVANAVFALTGQRVRQLPLRKARFSPPAD